MNETLKRAISGAVYIIILITSILYSLETFFLLFGVFLLIAVWEFCNLTQINKIFPLFLATISYGSVSYLQFHGTQISDNFYTGLLIASLTISIKCIIFLFNDAENKIELSSKYLYLLGYVILPFIILTKIAFGVSGYNPKILIGIFILIWTNDTFAYIVGKSIGKHKLLERISPKKTIEGFLGGMIFCILAGFLVAKYFILGKETAQYIWIGIAIIVSIFGTIGDLVESKFKRIANVKDSGNIMPGHGGILDRLDSVIFVAPFILLFYHILNYVTFP